LKLLKSVKAKLTKLLVKTLKQVKLIQKIEENHVSGCATNIKIIHTISIGALLQRLFKSLKALCHLREAATRWRASTAAALESTGITNTTSATEDPSSSSCVANVDVAATSCLL
jgi:hypothetical protein